MNTIAEKLQVIADSTSAIKQAIIDKGGTIEGDITTWADAIQGIESSGTQEAIPTNIVYSETANADNAKIYNFLMNLSLNGVEFSKSHSSNSCALSIDVDGISIRDGVGAPVIFTSDGFCKADASEFA